MFQLLTNLGVIAVPANVSKHVGGEEDVVGRECCARGVEEVIDGRFAVLFGPRPLIREPRSIGKPHVVELDLVEAGSRRFDGDADVVVRHLAAVWIAPGESFAVAIDRAVPPPHREVRPCLREQGVLEDDDSRNRVDCRSRRSLIRAGDRRW